MTMVSRGELPPQDVVRIHGLDLKAGHEFSVGRNEPNDIAFPDSNTNVSRDHAVIGRTGDGRLYVRDDKSMNGTYIKRTTNGRSSWEKLEQGKNHYIEPSDRIRLAEDGPILNMEQMSRLTPRDVARVNGRELKPNQQLSIGRRDNRDVRYSDADLSVSREHATIRRTDDGRLIINDTSSYGTYVNDRRIPPRQDYEIQPGDKIVLGERGTELDLDVMKVRPAPDAVRNKAAIDQSNEYATGHSMGRPLEPGFQNGGAQARFDENGVPSVTHRAITVYDPAKDTELRSAVARAHQLFDGLKNDPLTLMRKLNAYSNKLLSPSGMDGKALDAWYTAFDNANAGKQVLLGDFIKEGKGVCSQQAFLLKVLADSFGLETRMVRGLMGRHAWVTMDIGGEKHLFDPRNIGLADGARFKPGDKRVGQYVTGFRPYPSGPFGPGRSGGTSMNIEPKRNFVGSSRDLRIRSTQVGDNTITHRADLRDLEGFATEAPAPNANASEGSMKLAPGDKVPVPGATYMSGSSLKTYKTMLGLTDEELGAGKVVLDLGSGAEQELAKQAKAAGLKATVINVDPRMAWPLEKDLAATASVPIGGDIAPAIEARLRGRTNPEPMTLAAASHQLPVKDGSVDTIVSHLSVPMYIRYDREKISQTLNEFARVLKVGGMARVHPIPENNMAQMFHELDSMPFSYEYDRARNTLVMKRLAEPPRPEVAASTLRGADATAQMQKLRDLETQTYDYFQPKPLRSAGPDVQPTVLTVPDRGPVGYALVDNRARSINDVVIKPGYGKHADQLFDDMMSQMKQRGGTWNLRFGESSYWLQDYLQTQKGKYDFRIDSQVNHDGGPLGNKYRAQVTFNDGRMKLGGEEGTAARSTAEAAATDGLAPGGPFYADLTPREMSIAKEMVDTISNAKSADQAIFTMSPRTDSNTAAVVTGIVAKEMNVPVTVRLPADPTWAGDFLITVKPDVETRSIIQFHMEFEKAVAARRAFFEATGGSPLNQGGPQTWQFANGTPPAKAADLTLGALQSMDGYLRVSVNGRTVLANKAMTREQFLAKLNEDPRLELQRQAQERQVYAREQEIAWERKERLDEAVENGWPRQKIDDALQQSRETGWSVSSGGTEVARTPKNVIIDTPEGGVAAIAPAYIIKDSNGTRLATRYEQEQFQQAHAVYARGREEEEAARAAAKAAEANAAVVTAAETNRGAQSLEPVEGRMKLGGSNDDDVLVLTKAMAVPPDDKTHLNLDKETVDRLKALPGAQAYIHDPDDTISDIVDTDTGHKISIAYKTDEAGNTRLSSLDILQLDQQSGHWLPMSDLRFEKDAQGGFKLLRRASSSDLLPTAEANSLYLGNQLHVGHDGRSATFFRKYEDGSTSATSTTLKPDGSAMRTKGDGTSVLLNENGQQLQMIDKTGLAMTFEYDAEGHATRIKYGAGEFYSKPDGTWLRRDIHSTSGVSPFASEMHFTTNDSGDQLWITPVADYRLPIRPHEQVESIAITPGDTTVTYKRLPPPASDYEAPFAPSEKQLLKQRIRSGYLEQMPGGAFVHRDTASGASVFYDKVGRPTRVEYNAGRTADISRNENHELAGIRYSAHGQPSGTIEKRGAVWVETNASGQETELYRDVSVADDGSIHKSLVGQQTMLPDGAVVTRGNVGELNKRVNPDGTWVDFSDEDNDIYQVNYWRGDKLEERFLKNRFKPNEPWAWERSDETGNEKYAALNVSQEGVVTRVPAGGDASSIEPKVTLDAQNKPSTVTYADGRTAQIVRDESGEPVAVNYTKQGQPYAELKKEGDGWSMRDPNGRLLGKYAGAYFNDKGVIEPQDRQDWIGAIERPDGLQIHTGPWGRESVAASDLVRERDRVHKLFENSFKTPAPLIGLPGSGRLRLANEQERIGRITKWMDDFEQQFRSSAGEKADQAIANVYYQMDKLLSTDGAIMDKTTRARLAEQLAYKLSHPEVCQGDFNTCNVTAGIENRVLIHQPEVAARLISQVATTGKFIAGDGTIIDMTRVNGALKPFREAAMLWNKPFRSGSTQDITEDGSRDFFDQIFQTTAVNSYWQSYARESGKVANLRAGDYTPSNVQYEMGHSPHSPSGEYIVDYSGEQPLVRTIAEDVNTTHPLSGEMGPITEIRNSHTPNLGSTAIMSAHMSIASDQLPILATGSFKGGYTTDVESAQQLAGSLTDLQTKRMLPASIMVDGRDAMLNLQKEDLQRGRPHLINVQAIRTVPGPDGTTRQVVDVTNQWGERYNFIGDKAMSIEDLWRAMQPRGTETVTTPNRRTVTT
jgi:pSer/pThr/pTyr-binding forkhead associated (FHA) protein